MSLVVSLYWFFCYSVMVATLVVSGGRALRRDSCVEAAHFQLLVSYGLLLGGFTLILVLGPNLTESAEPIIGFVAVTGLCVAIRAIPAFAYCQSPMTPVRRWILRIATAAAVILWMANAFAWFTPAVGIVNGVTSVVLAAVIAGVSLYGLATRHREEPGESDRRWHRISSANSTLALVFLPAFVLFDFFGAMLPVASGLIGSGFRFFPLFFVLWDAVYLYHTFGPSTSAREAAPAVAAADPSAAAGAAPGVTAAVPTPGVLEPSEAAMDLYGLSPKERDVARLLAAGRSYKEIAAELDISMATAKTHINRIYAKTSSGNKLELVNALSSPPVVPPAAP